MTSSFNSLPNHFKDNPEKTIYIFTASDGKTYTNDKEIEIIPAKIITNSDGITRSLKFDNGETFAYPDKVEMSNKINPLDTNYNKCDFAFTGPYYRNWSQSGYGAMKADLTIGDLSLGSPINGKKWAGYTYLGFQTNNASVEVDVGFTFQDDKTFMFISNGSGVQAVRNPYHLIPRYKSYPVTIEFLGNNTWAFSYYVDGIKYVGQSSYYNLGVNVSGNDVYFKKMISLANNYYGNPKNGKVSFDSNTYNVSSISGSIGNAQLGTYNYSTNSYNYTKWSQSRVDYRECRVPRASMFNVTGGPSSDYLFVTINANQ